MKLILKYILRTLFSLPVQTCNNNILNFIRKLNQYKIDFKHKYINLTKNTKTFLCPEYTDVYLLIE